MMPQIDTYFLEAYIKQFSAQNQHKMLLHDMTYMMHMITQIKNTIYMFISMQFLGYKIEKINIPTINLYFTENEITNMFYDHANYLKDTTISHIIVESYYLRKILYIQLYILKQYKNKFEL